MAIEISCGQCGSTLRVGDEHAGKKAKCPQCENIVDVPMVSAGGVGAAPSPFADGTGQNPYGAPPNAPQHPGMMPGMFPGKPHRGGLILALGILGLLCCQLCGIPAWILGRNDLKEMDAGLMDPQGRGLTQAGMIIGIIAVVLMVLLALFYGVMILIAIMGNM